MGLVSRIFIVLVAGQLLFGCSDVTNELWIEKDGSGRMEISLDLASFLPQDLMSSMNQDSINASGEEIDVLLNAILKNGEVQQIDTSFNIFEILNLPDSVELTEKEKQSLESITVTLRGDTTSGTAIAKLAFEFEDEQSLENLMDPVQRQATRSDTLAREILKFKEDLIIDVERGIVRLPRIKPPANLPKDTPEDLNIGLESLEGDDEEAQQMRAMLETMMGKIITKLHLPGKVELTNDPEAEIDGHSVTFKRPIYSFMTNDSITPWLIKFSN